MMFVFNLHGSSWPNIDRSLYALTVQPRVSHLHLQLWRGHACFHALLALASRSNCAPDLISASHISLWLDHPTKARTAKPRLTRQICGVKPQTFSPFRALQQLKAPLNNPEEDASPVACQRDILFLRSLRSSEQMP